MIQYKTKLTTCHGAESKEAHMTETRLAIEVPAAPLEMGWTCPRCQNPRPYCTCGPQEDD